MSKTKAKLTGAETPLERAVQRWANGHADDYESGVEGVLSDLFQGGCQSGMVGDLIYYSDTLKFYKRHKAEIAGLLSELMDDLGADGPQGLFGDKWDTEDPLANDTHNQNLLAWFGFEETAQRLAGRNDIEL